MNARRRWKRIALAAAVGAAAILGWWFLRSGPSDEALILDLVTRAETAIEAKDKDALMACVAKDYRDEGGLSRLDIFRLAVQWQRSSEQVDITIGEYELDVESPEATGRFEVELVFHEYEHYESPVNLSLTVDFEKQRRRWRKVWLVTSVSGHGLESDFEGLL